MSRIFRGYRYLIECQYFTNVPSLPFHWDRFADSLEVRFNRGNLRSPLSFELWASKFNPRVEFWTLFRYHTILWYSPFLQSLPCFSQIQFHAPVRTETSAHRKEVKNPNLINLKSFSYLLSTLILWLLWAISHQLTAGTGGALWLSLIKHPVSENRGGIFFWQRW